MKTKKLFAALLVMLVAFVLVGCNGVKQEEHDKVLEELDGVKQELTDVQADLEDLQAQKAAVDALLKTAQDDLDDAIRAAAADKEKAEKDLEAAQKALTEANEAKEALDAQIAALQAEIAKLESEKIVVPTSIEVWGDEYVAVGNTTEPVEVDVTIYFEPADAYTGVLWTTSDPTIATVDAEGRVTGLRGGMVTITATSVLDPEVSYAAEWEVKEEGNEADVTLVYVNEVVSKLPKYVDETFTLPQPTNEQVTVQYYLNDVELEGGVFTYTEPAQDGLVAINAKFTYGNFSTEQAIQLRVVKDAENNDYLNIELAQTYVALSLDEYINGGKVASDVYLPTTFRGASIAWTTDKSYVLSNTGVYARPNDDTPVKLDAAYQLNEAKVSQSFNLVAKGYDAEEKMQYVLTEGSLKGLDTSSTNVDIILPTSDDKFGIELSYASSNVEVLDNNGKYVNRDLAEDTAVTYTVTFKYTNGLHSFEETKDVVVTALAATDTSKAAFDFLVAEAANATVPTYFPYGQRGRLGGNKIAGLATVVEGHEGVTVKWSGNAEDFESDLTLKTQYMRYHESVLTATFVKEGVEDTSLKFVVNTGVAQKENTMIVAGRFAEQTSTAPTERFDVLHTFSAFDEAVGVSSVAQQGRGFWSGYTFWVDGKTSETLPPVEEGGDPITVVRDVRWQYFVLQSTTVWVEEADLDEEDFFTPTTIDTAVDPSNYLGATGGNWWLFFVNTTEKEVKVPMATYGGGNGSDGVAWKATGTREHAVQLDGYRQGFVADAEGNVILGTSELGEDGVAVSTGVLQAFVPTTNKHEKSGLHYVTVPAGGYVMGYKTQQNNAVATGAFTVKDQQLNIELYDLHPANDARVSEFNKNLNLAEQGLEELEAGMVTEIPVDQHLINSLKFFNNPQISEAEALNFNEEKLNDLLNRSADIWDSRITDIKSKGSEEGYAVEFKALYDNFKKISNEVVELVDNVLVSWFEQEYLDKFKPFNITLELNEGVYYTATRQEVIDLFLADMFEHLQNLEFEGLAANFAAFKDQSKELFTAAFIDQYFYEFYSKNPNHLTVDDTATQFIRQSEYNEKWLPLLYFINDTTQIGHGGGRDILGRNGLAYEFHYVLPEDGSPLYDVVVNAQSGANTRVQEYINGNYAYGAYKEKFVEKNWTLSADASQAKADAAKLTYTNGDVNIELVEPVKAGFTFDGWFLDEGLTQVATLTPAGLGSQNVTLYAKWTPAE